MLSFFNFNKFDNYLKEIINMSDTICNTFTLSFVFDINILIVQYEFMFFLTSTLKGLNDNQGSKSKAAAKWIPKSFKQCFIS